jgi:spore germination protein KC
MRKAAVIVMLAALMTPAAGCAGKPLFDELREIDQLELIRTVGVDSSDGLVTATAASWDTERAVILKNRSVTLSRALSEMQSYTNKKYIFYGHTENLLIGQKAAEEGIDVCLDFIERSPDMRLSTKLYIVRDTTAERMISEAGKESGGIGSLLESLEKDVQLLSESYVFNCGDVAEMIAEDGCALAAAIMLTPGENMLRGGSESTVTAAGYAVFRDAELVRFIDRYYAHGVNLLTDRMEGDIAEVDDGEGGFAAIRLTHSDVRFSARFTPDGNIGAITADINVKGNLEQLQNPLDIYDPAVTERLESALEAMEKYRAEYVMELMKELEADFCRIGRRLEMRYPVRFSRIAGDWPRQLAGAETEVRVNAEILRTYEAGLSPVEAWRREDGEGQRQP